LLLQSAQPEFQYRRPIIKNIGLGDGTGPLASRLFSDSYAVLSRCIHNLMSSFIQTVRFIPAWFPLADFKRQGAEWRTILNSVSEVPHTWVKSEIVRRALHQAT
jgi:hypothetical protein